ncbi:MAG: SMP-30/gluconolactonase/LRE family protein [Planctomycetes bacterium]|nr:SMP-30/gluconolactonase/LRE family protein [Planctomycetota bacterium]
MGSLLPRLGLVLAAAALMCGCIPVVGSRQGLESVWGERGVAEGEFSKPRAMAIDGDDQLYIVDMTGRIQVFSPEGEFLRSWRTPTIEKGKPSGLSFDRQGNLLVADTHYFRTLFYTPGGKMLRDRTIGGVCGHGPGEFNFVTDAVQDSRGNYYIAEYGEYDRIQKFTPEGEFVLQWGGHGEEPGQFIRPQNLAIDERDQLWVADACNHRIQVFDVSGDEPKLARVWGEQGAEPGQLCYPYDLALDGDGHVYVCEFGNHRVQKFTTDGVSVGCWGVQGRREGELHNPWALVLDSRGRVHVLDTYNHRVQRIRL